MGTSEELTFLSASSKFSSNSGTPSSLHKIPETCIDSERLQLLYTSFGLKSFYLTQYMYISQTELYYGTNMFLCHWDASQ